MEKKILRPSTALYPVPAVLVSCGDADGKKNIITLAWVGTLCSEPPMVGISVRPNRFSHGLIREKGEFVVNLPQAAQAKITDYCGVVSGRGVDKFTAAGLTPVQGSQVKAPLIAECPVNLECRVRQTLALGSHDLFIGEIVAVQADTGVLDAAGRIDMEKASPLVYADSRYYGLGRLIDNHGFSFRK